METKPAALQPKNTTSKKPSKGNTMQKAMLEEMKLLDDLKLKIEKSTEVDQRKMHLEFVSNYKKYLENNAEFDQIEKRLYGEYSEKVEAISADTDKIIRGNFELNKTKINQLKEIFGDVFDKENKEGMNNCGPIPGYWMTVLKNADLKWGDKDPEMLEDLQQINVTNKMNKQTRAVHAVEVEFIFNFKDKEPRFKAKRQLEADAGPLEGNLAKLWVKTVYDEEILKRIECSGIDWFVGKNPLINFESKEKNMKKFENQKKTSGDQNMDIEEEDKQMQNEEDEPDKKIYESILDIFDDDTHFQKIIEKWKKEANKGEPEQEMFHMNRQEIERIVDEMGNVVAFSLEYYLGIMPQMEEDDFDNDFDDEN